MILLLAMYGVFAQSFNDDKTALSNFLKRMYSSSQFDGVKVIDDYDHKYVISVVALDKSKYTSQSTMNRVAQVKARQQANAFFNGSSITSDLIIKTSESKKDSFQVVIETTELIKEQTSGFVEGMELLANFDSADGTKAVFIFIRKLEGK